MRIAGADCAYDPGGGRCAAAVAVLAVPALTVAEVSTWVGPVEAPYVPGRLALREAGPILRALAGLSKPPDLLLVDGHGKAHPERRGLACTVGEAAGLPTVGVAKDLLVGHHAPLPGARGSRVPLVDRGEVVGAAVRTRAGVKPVFVSVGWGLALEPAVALVLRVSPRYRIPEPLRAAHASAREALE
ncbi:MAG: endonuclease V [Candidatus Dadabacteria bacterium]|nr:MAG: endonuclease V [Candidatus Dadabacteria bacterium]